VAEFPGGPDLEDYNVEDELDDEASEIQNNNVPVSRTSSVVSNSGQSSSSSTTGNSLCKDKIYCITSSGVCINYIYITTILM
jgi:hypothetical protein